MFRKSPPPNFENDKVAPDAEGSRVIAVSFTPQTKTTLDGFQPKFEDGKDTVLISNTNALDTCVVSVDDKTGKATISTNLTGSLTAVYPYTAAGMNGSNLNQIDTVLVSTIQSGKFADANICMARMTDEKDESLSFENKTAVFCIYPPTDNPEYVEVSADGFEIANDVPTGSTHTSLETIHVSTTTADSVWVSILVPGGLKVSDLTFSDGTNEKVIPAGNPADKEIAVNTLYTVTKENWKGPEADIPEPLEGVFTVGNGADGIAGTDDDIKVRFSQGNLYCKRSSSASNDWTWHFYSQQYEFLAADMAVIGSETKPQRTVTGDDTEIDLFTWGYDATESINPKGTAYIISDVEEGETFSPSEDWGYVFGGESSVWRTLTTEEWQYLFSYDGRAEGGSNYDNAIRCDKYKCGVTVCSKPNCVVIAPDNWDIGKNPLKETYTAAEWAAVEAAGLVCLPAAGYRNGSKISDVGKACGYWSSTLPYRMRFNEVKVYPIRDNVAIGSGVRLVTDVSAAPFFGIEWEDIVSGTYVSAATHAVILDNLPGKEIPTVLQQRKDQPSTYRLRNVFGDGMHLIINAIDQFGEDDGGKYQFLRIPVQNTGLIHASYGAISVRDIGYWQGDDSYITESGYESGMYEDHSCFFKMQWFVSVGSIGYNWYDYFVPDEE